MTQSALLGLAGLSIGAVVVTGLTLFAIPLDDQAAERAERAASATVRTAVAEANVGLTKSGPERSEAAQSGSISQTGPTDPIERPRQSAAESGMAAPLVRPPPPKKLASDSERKQAALPAGEAERREPTEPTMDASKEPTPGSRPRFSALVAPPPAPPAPEIRQTVSDQDSRSKSDERLSDVPAWRRYAALAPSAGGKPRIVVVLDDMGLSEYRSDRAVALPRPVTMAILPYGPEPHVLVSRARAAGHEVIVHLPMEPSNSGKDPGPHALVTGLSMPELDRRIRHNLDRMSGYVGVNNHMGSRFTASERDMDRLMAILKARGLLFLDSLTTGRSVGRHLAEKYGVPAASRDIFLDNSRSARAIARQLAKVEQQAREHGHAIAIGHPYPETLDALSQWLPQLKAKGFELVPISAIVRDRLTG